MRALDCEALTLVMVSSPILLRTTTLRPGSGLSRKTVNFWPLETPASAPIDSTTSSRATFNTVPVGRVVWRIERTAAKTALLIASSIRISLATLPSFCSVDSETTVPLMKSPVITSNWRASRVTRAERP